MQPHAHTTERRKEERHDPAHTITLISGDYYVTDKPGKMIVTILGSCVAACMRDPVMRVGGMNHFLLPEGPSGDFHHPDAATRYGAYAMEQLINGIIARGGMKSRLEVKIFGGANVIDSSAMIGSKNVEFVREFMRAEHLNVASEDLGGDYPRRLRYYPDTGKVMLLKLRRKEDFAQVSKEERKMQKAVQKPVEGSVELF